MCKRMGGKFALLISLFHFHGIFKETGAGGGSSEPPETPLDPQLFGIHVSKVHVQQTVQITTFNRLF